MTLLATSAHAPSGSRTVSGGIPSSTSQWERAPNEHVFAERLELPHGGMFNAHKLLFNVIRECDKAIRAKRLDVGLYYLARDTHSSSDVEQLRAVYIRLLGIAITAAPIGGTVTLRCSNPTDCALRVEIEERSSWRMELPPSPAAREEPLAPFIEGLERSAYQTS